MKRMNENGQKTFFHRARRQALTRQGDTNAHPRGDFLDLPGLIPLAALTVFLLVKYDAARYPGLGDGRGECVDRHLCTIGL